MARAPKSERQEEAEAPAACHTIPLMSEKRQNHERFICKCMPIKTRTKIYNEEKTLGGERKEKANTDAALAFLLQKKNAQMIGKFTSKLRKFYQREG